MNPAPIPQPAAQTCPNCGAAVDGNVKLCPNCGAALGVSSKSSGTALFFQIILGLAAVGFALSGACFILIGPAFVQSVIGSGSSFGMIVYGIGALFVAGLCIWGIIRLGRNKNRG